MTLLPLRAQARSARKPSFEVASIKVNRTDAIGLMIDTRGDLFVATNATLRMLIRYAYSSHQVLQSYQIIGGPDWLDGPDRFDIQAKLGANVRSLPAEQVLFMLQALLEDRFQMKSHREIRGMPVYNLLVAKNGMKMKFSSDQTVPNLNGQSPLIFDNSIALPRGTMKLILPG